MIPYEITTFSSIALRTSDVPTTGLRSRIGFAPDYESQFFVETVNIMHEVAELEIRLERPETSKIAATPRPSSSSTRLSQGPSSQVLITSYLCGFQNIFGFTEHNLSIK